MVVAWEQYVHVPKHQVIWVVFEFLIRLQVDFLGIVHGIFLIFLVIFHLENDFN